MRISLIALAALLVLCAPHMRAQSDTPLMTSVDPQVGSVGDVFAVEGDNLDDVHVAAIYLSDGKNDTKLPITQQTATSLKFKIPPEAKAGRFALMVLTKGKNARYVEEPVKITVEAPAAKPNS